MKRLLSLVLCALLLVSLVVPVYAETDPTETTAATDASTEAETEAASEESTETATEDATEAETEEATEESTEEATEPAATQSAEVTEKTASMNDVAVNVSGAIPEEVSLSVEEADVEHSDFGVENSEDIVAAMDITLMDEQGEEWQPEESVTVTIDALSLGLAEGDEVEIMHEHEGVVTSLGIYAVMDGKLTFPTNGFSIYVVTTANNATWNKYNYAIMMSVGDTLAVSTSTSGNTYDWRIIAGDTNLFELSNTTGKTIDITANAPGTIKLQCEITSSSGGNSGGRPGSNSGSNSKTTEEIDVTAVTGNGDISNDIIFKNITAEYLGDGENNVDAYDNTYGTYVMKIRFEDTDGNLLEMGQDYYVFDSAVPININTFAADAPAGYTYDGAYFYWSGHYSGTKSYVSEVTRLSTLGTAGSYLYFDYITSEMAAVSEDTYYQPSGVLHIVYRKSDEAYSVLFKDHEGTLLHSFAPAKADIGYATIPAAYMTTLDITLETELEENHGTLSDVYIFTGNWVVAGGGNGIDGTYTTDELKSQIPNWRITSDITITAQCAEPSVTINYVPSPNTGGSVSIPSETVKVSSEDTNGSTATPNTNYKFVGWFTDVDCTQAVDSSLVDANNHFTPAKVDGKNISATYYAKFELDVGNLTITKTVDGVAKNDMPAELAFTFTVSGPNGYETTVILNADNDWTYTVPNLTVGDYTVVETKVDIPNYKLTKVTANDTDVTDNASTTVSVTGGATTEVNFVNTYALDIADLTIIKNGGSGELFEFSVVCIDRGIDMTVCVPGGGSITLKDLPLGTYTVKEDTGWSYRYSCSPPSGSVTIEANKDNSLTFTNTLTNDKWLGGESFARNIFTGSTGTTG